MTTIFIIILFISQLICFYLIFILNSKISKFKDLEVRQNKLMEEMENTISVYLLEMKEENDRFINELSSIKIPQQNQPQHIATIHLEEQSSAHANKELQSKKEQLEQVESNIEKIQVVPKSVAKNAYIRQRELPKAQQKNSEQTEEHSIPVQEDIEKGNLEQNAKSEESYEEKILKLHNEGKTVEEIAKITQKGKTEIELLLKFQT